MVKRIVVTQILAFICVAQDLQRQVLELSGEARAVGLLHLVRSSTLTEKSKAIVLGDLESESTQVAFRFPLRLTTNVVADQEHGYSANASRRMASAQVILVELSKQKLGADPYLSSRHYLNALSEAGRSFGCGEVAAPDLNGLSGMGEVLLKHPSSHAEKRRDFWDALVLVDQCKSVACVNLLIDIVMRVGDAIPEDFRLRMLQKSLAALGQLQSSERDLYLELVNSTQFLSRAESLASFGLKTQYFEAVSALAFGVVSRERCKDLWDNLESGKKLPSYLEHVFALSGMVLKEDDSRLRAILSSNLVSRQRVKYFWGGEEGSRLITELKHFHWSFRDGSSSRLLTDIEQRAKLVKFIEDAYAFAKETQWNRHESVMIRSIVLSRIAPFVSTDVALSAWLIDKMDALFVEVRGNRFLEAIVLYDAMATAEIVKAKSKEYKELINTLAGKLRSSEVNFIFRQNSIF